MFPGNTSATHYINPAREWHKIEKKYPVLRSALAPDEPEKQGALMNVKINDKVYMLTAEFVEQYPTLLHLLARLSTEDPSFLLNNVTLTFGSSVPRSVKSIFILETPPGVQPWCVFQYEIPITKRNTVVIKSLMKKARRAAEAPTGCNIVNAKGLRFETVTAVATVSQLQPELKTINREQLNFKGSAAECKRLGAIFTAAHKRGETLALYFNATVSILTVTKAVREQLALADSLYSVLSFRFLLISNRCAVLVVALSPALVKGNGGHPTSRQGWPGDETVCKNSHIKSAHE